MRNGEAVIPSTFSLVEILSRGTFKEQALWWMEDFAEKKLLAGAHGGR
jgi:hypothetical protein